MDSVALGDALTSIGGNLDVMAQQGFTQQANAAKAQQATTLAQLHEQGENSRQQTNIDAENTRQATSLAQSGAQFQQSFGEKQQMDQHTIQNQDTNTGLRADEVASGDAEKAQNIAASQAKTPAEVAELQARAAGADKLPAGVTGLDASVASKEYETAVTDARDAQKAMASAAKNNFGSHVSPEYTQAKQAAADAASRLQGAQQRLEDLRTGVGGSKNIQPKAPAGNGGAAPPSPAASASPAAAAPPPQTATNPQTGEKLQLVNGQWVPANG